MPSSQVNIIYFSRWFIDGVPYDGGAETAQHPLHTAVTIIYFILASVGLVYTILCLLFNTLFRNRKWVYGLDHNVQHKHAVLLNIALYSYPRSKHWICTYSLYRNEHVYQSHSINNMSALARVHNKHSSTLIIGIFQSCEAIQPQPQLHHYCWSSPTLHFCLYVHLHSWKGNSTNSPLQC